MKFEHGIQHRAEATRRYSNFEGHIRERGRGHWYAVIEAVNEAGKRKRKWHKLKADGKKRARIECSGLIAAMDQGTYVEPKKISVADFVRARVDQWEAAGNISARTAQRYRELVENQIVPHIGDKVLQKLRTIDIEQWHTALRIGGRANGSGGIAARTIGHAHRVLSKALSDAVKNDFVLRNVAKSEAAPKVTEDEMAIVQDVPALVEKLRGERLHMPTMVALFTGMRLPKCWRSGGVASISTGK